MSVRTIVVVGLLCLALPVATFAQGFTQGDKVLSLGGSGVSDDDFGENNFTVEGSFDYFFTDNLSGGIRQGLSFIDTAGGDNDWSGATRVALDYNFDMGRWWPYLGGNFGYVYGDLIDDTFVAGPEAGVRYFVNETTFLLGAVEYEFFFDDSDDVDSAFDDGRFIYTLAMGFRW